MSVLFRVLASGSSGNCSVLGLHDQRLLIDCGLSVRALTARLTAAGLDWSQIRAAVLTHIHDDHWKETALGEFVRRGIRLHCHPEHAAWLSDKSPAFNKLADRGLVMVYRTGKRFEPLSDVGCQAFDVAHDAGATCGFRFDGELNAPAKNWSIGYAADLGCWDDRTVFALADVDLLALEFNHDVPLQWATGRPAFLVQRIIGDQGHLSNEQAAELLTRILRVSQPGRVRQVVQLHLSREANRPELARRAAALAIQNYAFEQGLPAGRPVPRCAVHTACQHEPSPPFVRTVAAAESLVGQ